MFCQECGSPIASGIQYCPGCSANVLGQTIAPPPANPEMQAGAAPGPVVGRYAGFWFRSAAHSIDGFIVWLASFAIQILMGIDLTSDYGAGDPDIAESLSIFGLAGIYSVVVTICDWLYEALLTSSHWQATLGKRAVGIIVTDESGRRISFPRATGRYFGKLLSGLLLLIGYLIQPFTPKKQALHDILAHTLVLKAPANRGNAN